MNLDKITSTENFIEAALKKAAEDTANIQEELRKLEAEKDAAIKAQKSLNAKKIMEAKFNEIAATNAIDDLENRLDELKSKPLISKSEYERQVKLIYEEVDGIAIKARKTFVKLAEEMRAASKDLEQAQARANNALSRLQYEVYKDADADYVRDSEGRIMYSRRYAQDETTGDYVIVVGEPTKITDEKRIDLSNLINWGIRATSTTQYAQAKNDGF